MSFNADRELQDPTLNRDGAAVRAPADAAAPELRSYLSLLWRRKWILLPFLVLIPIVVHFATARGTSTYEASSQVLLNRQSANVSGLGDPLVFDAARTIRTQAGIARVPVIARRVIEAAKLDWSPGEFLGRSSVGSDPDVDLLTFRVRDEEPARAELLSNLYAETYIEYRRRLDTTALSEALRILRQQIEQLRSQGLASSGGYSALVDRRQQLQTAMVLQKSNAILVQHAEGAAQVTGPNRQNDYLAIGAGIIIALALAFLIDALDTRIRSADDLAAELRLPLLGGLREPRSVGRRGRLVMLDAPTSESAEMFRILRSTLDVGHALDRQRVLMVTSALAGEGKSTTAANLAIAMARAGQRVVLADLDLPRPRLKKLFRLPPGPGVTDVLLAKARLEDALVRIPLAPAGRQQPADGLEESGNGRRHDGGYGHRNGSSSGGTLDVICAGEPVRHTGDFLLTPTLDELFAHLRELGNVVVVDGPPLLVSADALTLSSHVDALLLVARANTLRREQIGQVRRALAVAPAAKLGLVVVGDMGSQTGPYYHYPPARESSQQLVR
jgi:Mrp family chromosome partitioning ATPase/capsular polysaccharide biosynthesis protein